MLEMTLEKKAHVILEFARVLFVNGQATDQIIAVTAQLAAALKINAKIIARWGELQLEVVQDNTELLLATEASPISVNMQRVELTMRAIDAVCSEKLSLADAPKTINAIEKTSFPATWLFTLAAALGAVALSVLYGVQHIIGVGLIFISAALGAILRRYLARISSNLFIQPCMAALLAGAIGSLATHYGLSSSLRLVALCPCMILIPGPHVLNSALDMIQGRLHLGMARFAYATLIILAISIGLLLGLSVLNIDLPIDALNPTIPLWQDVLAAGVAIAAFSLFFSMPFSMLAWPMAIGMLAHALRWIALVIFNKTLITSDFIACLMAGIILTLISRHKRLPFAAIGFAATVSMIPSIFLFRAASGLVRLTQEYTNSQLTNTTISNGINGIMIIIAISLGLIIPRIIIDYLAKAIKSKRT